MERRSKTTRCLLLSAAFATGALTGPALAQPPAYVGVYAEHHGGNVIYRYEIANRGTQPVRVFRVGCDCGGAASGQLTTLPAAAQPRRRDGRGVWYELPSGTVGAPAGWRARLLWPHGAAGYWIEWYTPDPRPDAGVDPGARLAGFSVEVAGPDHGFLEADASVGGAPGERLRLLDLEPPKLALRARSTRPAPGAASFRIVTEVRDNRDPQPRVTLESFEPARQAPGSPAAWIVTYSAADASGNRTTARTRITRPGPGGQEAGGDRPRPPRLLRLAGMP